MCLFLVTVVCHQKMTTVVSQQFSLFLPKTLSAMEWFASIPSSWKEFVTQASVRIVVFCAGVHRKVLELLFLNCKLGSISALLKQLLTGLVLRFDFFPFYFAS